jgi:DNA repair protein RecN (Recombination protein N)
MLAELHVRDLGVISDLSLVLVPGMTALTGETGAGKTLVVEAIELLVGGKADALVVRPGAAEAVVEGRFTVDLDKAGPVRAGLDNAGADNAGPDDPEEARLDGASPSDELIVGRVVPAAGRSRAYLDGRMATAAALAEATAGLVDLHGQHAHQSLLTPAAQRDALDAYGRVDLAPLEAARAHRRQLEHELEALGGDARARAREIDLLRFQVDELDAAGLGDPAEDEALAGEEERLAGATAHRHAATLAATLLASEDGAGDPLGRAVAAVAGRAPLAMLEERLRALATEVAELAADIRDTAESLEDDPQRLDEVRARRQLLRQLCRKYGDDVPTVLAYADEARKRLAELESWEERASALEAARQTADAAVVAAQAAVRAAREKAAPKLAAAVQARLRDLAMPKARIDVVVGQEGAGDEVVFLLGANPGEETLPLARVASGGELARAMLALRLTLTGPGSTTGRTLVFDEVDAGVGGEAAIAVGRALAELARSGGHQVLVVTHLAQVAACADHQIAVAKEVRGGRTLATAAALDQTARVVELARMLSGQPDSPTARRHAEELLAAAQTVAPIAHAVAPVARADAPPRTLNKPRR